MKFKKQIIFVLHGKEYQGLTADSKEIDETINEIASTYFASGVIVNYLKLGLFTGDFLLVPGSAMPHFSIYTKEVVTV
jgi:hypothetical protein